MVKKHLSRLTAPKSWPIKTRKGIKWIVKPSPGPHALNHCVPLSLVIKHLLKYAKTTREVKKILNEEKVRVDGKARKDHRFPIGVMDVLETPETKEAFRMLYTLKGKFKANKISAGESKLKPAKIVGKRILKGKKIQLNLYDGKNMIVDKGEFKVNDTLMLSMDAKPAIKKHLKFEKGALVYLIKGKHMGLSGTIEEIKPVFRNQIIKVKSKNKTFETSKDFAFVIDDSISLGEAK